MSNFCFVSSSISYASSMLEPNTISFSLPVDFGDSVVSIGTIKDLYNEIINMKNEIVELKTKLNKIEELEKKVVQLEVDLNIEKFKPPGLGGSEYEKAKLEFEQLSLERNSDAV